MKKRTATENEAVLENEVLTDQSIDETSETQESTEGQELSEVDKLINKRTGFWEIGLEEADVKWIRNHCNSKFSFTGPNEAFMLMNCYLGFASSLGRHEEAVKNGINPGPFVVQAGALEACAMLINRFEGSGLESAQRIFRIAIALNGPISEMKKLDDQISVLRAEAQTSED
jgi:hypothetical protein